MKRLLALLPMCFAAAAAAQTQPHASFHQLVSSNGYTAAIFDETRARLVGFREHLYQSVASGVPVRDLAYDSYFGLRVGGAHGWLAEYANAGSPAGAPTVGYLPGGTGVIQAQQSWSGSVQATTFVFAPMDLPAPAAVLLLHVQNAGSAPLDAAAAAFAILNFHVGDGADQTSGEHVAWDPTRGLFTDRASSGRVMVYRPLGAITHHGASPQDPYALVNAGMDLVDVADSGVIDDAVAGFQWSLAGLAPGADRWLGVLVGYQPFGDDVALDKILETWIANRTPDQLVAAEAASWAAWHMKTIDPPGLSDDERALHRQQVALLRMGQVREPNDAGAGYLPHGQIVASLPPGKWNIAWVRDATVAIRALVRSGHLDEARDALDFFLAAKAGGYVCCDKEGGPYVGVPYQISVVRYFGGGTEESDSDANGPNVEWDGFGLFLDALDQWERASGDTSFAESRWALITVKIADVIASLVDTDGLLRADSSIWETHWENGGRQKWVWSDVQGALGLRAAAALAARHGYDRSAATYAQAADALAAAIAAKLVGADGTLGGRTGSDAPVIDAQAVDAFVRGVLPPDGAVALATLDRMRAALRVASGHGYRRNLGPSEYDAREWVFVDLRTASALRYAGRAPEADALLAWVTAQSRANHDLIAENYDPTTSDYAGETPMIGFGAGAYVLALFERTDPPPGPFAGAPDGGAPSADGGTPIDMAAAKPMAPGSCGCRLGARSPSTPLASVLAFALAGLALARIRRRSIDADRRGP